MMIRKSIISLKSITRSQFTDTTDQRKKLDKQFIKLHPTDVSKFSLLMFDDSYSGLKHTLNLGDIKQTFGQFLLWSLGECHVEASELSD